MRIRSKLVYGIGGVSLAMLTALGAILMVLIHGTLSARINAELQNTLKATVSVVRASTESSIHNHLQSVAEKARDLCAYYQAKADSGELSPAEAKRRARDVLLDPRFGRIGQTGYLAGVDLRGVLVMHPKSEGADVSGQAFMQEAIKMREGYLEYEWKNEGEASPRAKAAYVTLFEPWGMLLWASSYKDEFSDIVHPESMRTHLLAIKIGDTGYPYVVDKKGTLIVHPKLEGTNLWDRTDADGKVYFIREMIEDPNDAGAMYYRWRNAEDEPVRKKFQYYQDIPELGWTVAISAYVHEYFDVVYLLLAVLAGSLVLIMAALLLPLFWFSGRMTIALDKVRLTLGDLASGDLTSTAEVRTGDELETMAESCNRVAAELGKSVRTTKTVIEKARFLSDDLAGHSAEVAATVNEMSAAMGTMKDGIETLHGELRSSDESLSRIRAHIRSVVDLIGEQGLSVSESSSAIDQMLAGVDAIERMTQEKRGVAESLSGMAKTGELNMRETVGAIAEIRTSTSTILDLVGIINGVAAQTNLLAMNAAIEAAHAGEYGAGFAVVADEIRKLAETSSRNARDASVSLKAIAAKIESASAQTEQTNETFRGILGGIGEVSAGMIETINGLREIAVGSRQVTKAMETLASVTANVKTSGGGMSEQVDNVASSLKTVYETMDAYRMSVAEAADGTREISAALVRLSDLSIENRENVNLLEESVDRFTLA